MDVAEMTLMYESGKSIRAIARAFDTYPQLVRGLLKSAGLRIKPRSEARRLYSFNEDFFESPNEHNSYWAGFIAADFAIRRPSPKRSTELSCALASKDKDQLVRFLQSINSNKSVKERIRFRKGTKLHCAEVWVSSNKFAEDLEANFNICSTNKTERLNPPTNLNRECELAFIVGYIDGDGWLRYEKGQGIDLGVCGTFGMVSWIKSVLDNELTSVDMEISRAVKVSTQSPGLCFWKAYSRSLYLATLLEQVPVVKMGRKLPMINLYKEQMLASIKRRGLSSKVRLKNCYKTSNASSKFKGVGKPKGKPYYQVYLGERTIGGFEDEIAAAQHYDYFMLQKHNAESFHLNFPTKDYTKFEPSIRDRRKKA